MVTSLNSLVTEVQKQSAAFETMSKALSGDVDFETDPDDFEAETEITEEDDEFKEGVEIEIEDEEDEEDDEDMSDEEKSALLDQIQKDLATMSEYAKKLESLI
jgi:hypothetical protein